jgi:hypothetical protein
MQRDLVDSTILDNPPLGLCHTLGGKSMTTLVLPAGTGSDQTRGPLYHKFYRVVKLTHLLTPEVF